MFYQSALQSFIHFNKFLQRGDPIVPIVQEQMESFVRKLASKFVLLSVMKATKGDFSDIPYKDRDSQLVGDNLHAQLRLQFMEH